MRLNADTSWTEIRQSLTGLRLAIYDRLLENGADTFQNLAATRLGELHCDQMGEAIAWLETARLLTQRQGMLRATRTSDAQRIWEEQGPAIPLGMPQQLTVPTMPPNKGTEQTSQPVQTHQTQFFSMEGYGT